MRAVDGPQECHLRSGPILQLDETTVQVLEESGRANTSTSYMWAARGGATGAPIIVYYYAPSRGMEVAKEMLGEFQGHLQTDGYEVYDRVSESATNVIHVGCWSHVRRKFFEAQKSSKNSGSAEVTLALIAKLYKAEGERALHKTPEEFVVARRRVVEPTLAEFRSWLDRRAPQVPPETLLGKAIGYSLRQWPKLLRYLDLAELTPDTNAIENTIRPFVLGRKNWLFSGSPRGAAASARLFSIIETAKANGQEPYWYLIKLFDELPAARSEDDLLRLAPFRSRYS